MIIFLDENDVEYGALATIKATNAVNGERSITGEIISGDIVLSRIERGWRLRFEDEYYVVTFAKPIDEGKNVQVSFDAVHQFFWDFGKSSVYDQLSDGSHTFRAYLDFIFNDSGYRYDIESSLTVKAFEKQSFGYKNRLSLFNDIITSSGVEFQVNGKVVRILAKVGTDLSTVVRKNFNLNELGIEKNIGNFVTYQKGFGAYFDEEDHSKGRLIAEYTSPLASVYGKLEADPLVDERYKQQASLLSALKETVDNSYTISVSLDMEDLTRAGYRYTQPVAGDYIMAINETLGFKEKIRIVSFTSEYDVAGQLIKHTVTCNDIGSVKKLSASYTQTQHQAANAEVNANTAYEFANKALVSANGKNTNYYGDTFPVDNPKGTLKKGDLLFLTVGDTVKQYYWNGAEWVTNPVVSDVEAFKEQIAEELKDVPNREEFENKISEEIANSKAEIGTQIETAKTQAESNAKEYADTINQETAKIAEQANTAANEIKADLVNVKNNLTATSLVANNAQAAVDAAKQELTEVASELNTAKQEFANSVTAVDTKVDSTKAELTQAKQDLMSHAQQLQTQANAQTELTKRVTTVETTANGTKTTVNELTKTVAQNGKDITSVTNRTKTVEDDLANTKTTLTQVQTTANSASQKTATLETGLNGLSAKFDSLKIGSVNLLKNSKTFTGSNIIGVSTILNETYQGCAVRYFKNTNPNSSWQDLAQFNNCVYPTLGGEYVASFLAKGTGELSIFFHGGSNYLQVASGSSSWGGNPASYDGRITLDLTDDWKRYWIKYKLKTEPASATSIGKHLLFRHNNSSTKDEIWLAGVQLEEGNIATDYNSNEDDLEQKVAEYKQNADQNYASLQTTVQNLDGTVQHNKTVAEQTAEGFKTRIESLETYKSGESERANAYFESAKTETAKQLTAERTAIANNYVAKSTYTSDVTGIRNELSATTSTANATKTNLANYQATNDKVVANLQSNIQTANGDISSLKTKVEAVPGQITSAVSAVESKIPTEIGSVNLLKNSKTFTGSNITGVSTILNETYQGCAVRYFKNTNPNSDYQDLANFLSCVIPKSEGDYVASFWAKGSGTVSVFFYNGLPVDSFVTSQGVSGNLGDGRATFTLSENWQRYWIKYKLQATTGQQTVAKNLLLRHNNNSVEDETYLAGVQLEEGNIASGYEPSPEDIAEQISSLSSQIKQTADGITLLATKTEVNSAKAELQSGINTATNKANNAQATANSNAQTISTHTTQISALNTGLSAKVSQTDFNTLSGRVTTAENNIIAKANELSSKITSVESKIPTEIGAVNLLRNSKSFTGSNIGGSGTISSETYQGCAVRRLKVTGEVAIAEFTNCVYPKLGGEYVASFWAKGKGRFRVFFYGNSGYLGVASGLTSEGNTETRRDDGMLEFNLTADWKRYWVKYKLKNAPSSATSVGKHLLFRTPPNGLENDVYLAGVQLEEGNIVSGYAPNSEDYDSKLSTMQSEFKQTTDSIKASVQSLDNNTVKSSSLTINTDGVVIKAGKSTSDFANAVGSYFSVNQNAINLFSDKINVKGNMIVSGAITSDKIASKQINTSHLNGKIITADVISSNAVTADAIRAGAVTTDKMSANSINGDRITAGTLDAAKIRAGSITASQIASGTITSAQIKTGTISAANIAAGAITSDKIAANSIDASKIAANAITANMIRGGQLRSTNGATVFDLNAGTLTFNNNYGYIQRIASDKVFEITTLLGTANSRDYLTSAFNIRKSDNSRRAGIKFTLYNALNDKPTAEADINADALTLYDSQYTRLFEVWGKSAYMSNFNFRDWGDIPVAQIHGGFLAKDIGLSGHTETLKVVVERLCKKAGVMWL